MPNVLRVSNGVTVNPKSPLRPPPLLINQPHDPLLLPQAGGVEEHLAGPAVDVAGFDLFAHHAHALALLVLLHGERPVEGLAHGVGVVGVDDQGLGELARGAGEGGEDEDALLVVAGGDEFLGDEVHPVMQG